MNIQGDEIGQRQLSGQRLGTPVGNDMSIRDSENFTYNQGFDRDVAEDYMSFSRNNDPVN